MYALKPLLIKVVVFVALLILFFTLGGFEPPRLSRTDYRRPSRMRTAWVYTVILYVAGAFTAVWRDHWEGVIHPVSYRGVFILFGILMMLAGLLWMRALKDTATADAQWPNHAQQRTRRERPGYNSCVPWAESLGRAR